MTEPYRATQVFTETTLPEALRREHRTTAGAWGIIRVLEGKLQLNFPDGRSQDLSVTRPGLIRPEEPHWVEPQGPMRMMVEFYDREPPGELSPHRQEGMSDPGGADD